MFSSFIFSCLVFDPIRTGQFHLLSVVQKSCMIEKNFKDLNHTFCIGHHGPIIYIYIYIYVYLYIYTHM
jgi:hypothetical protein